MYDKPTLVYSVEPSKKDNQEVLFNKSHMFVGIEGMMLYSELQDGRDTVMDINQESDGLAPLLPPSEPQVPESTTPAPIGTRMSINDSNKTITSTFAPPLIRNLQPIPEENIQQPSSSPVPLAPLESPTGVRVSFNNDNKNKK